MLVLQALTPAALKEAVPSLLIEEARRIVSAVHRRRAIPSAIRGVRRESLASVRACAVLYRLESVSVRVSPVDGFVKYALRTTGGAIVEAVRIPLEHPGRVSACLSSQAGCALACSFCATGSHGFFRNLEPWEILDQVRVISEDGALHGGNTRVHGIVFQGMGEPMLNLDNVLKAVRVLCEPSAFAIDSRAMTICTAGIPEGIRVLAREAPKVRLGISIGSARSSVRRQLIPLERIYPLRTVVEAAADHAMATGLAPMWALTLLKGINDSGEEARALLLLAEDFYRSTGLKPRISLVPYNPIRGGTFEPYQRTSRAAELEFRRVIHDGGFATHLRYSGGSDIGAACGQLAAAGHSLPSGEPGTGRPPAIPRRIAGGG